MYALGQDPIVIPEAGFLRQPQLVGHPVCVFICMCVCVCVCVRFAGGQYAQRTCAFIDSLVVA